MSFDAGSIVGRMNFDISEFTHGMLEAGAISNLFPHVVTEFIANPLLAIIGVAKEMAAGVKDAFLEIARGADNMGELAEKAGVSVEFLTTVGKVAADSGSSIEGLADSMKFLGKNLVDATAGGQEAEKLAGVFAAIGVSGSDLKSSLASDDLEGLFFKVADGIKGLGSGAEKTKVAMELLGRGGTEMIPTFNKGSASIKAFAQDIADLGGGVTKEEADLGDKFGTLETVIGAAFEGIKKSVAVPILEAFGVSAEDITAKVKELAGEIRAGVAGAMELLRPVASGLWETFKGLAHVVGELLAPAFTVLVPVLKIVSELLGAILDVVGKVLGGVGDVVHGITDFFGLTSEGDRVTPGQAKAAAAGPGGVNVEKVNVAAVDTQAASSHLAAKIAPQIQAAQRQQVEQLKSAAQSHQVARAVKGRA